MYCRAGGSWRLSLYALDIVHHAAIGGLQVRPQSSVAVLVYDAAGNVLIVQVTDPENSASNITACAAPAVAGRCNLRSAVQLPVGGALLRVGPLEADGTLLCGRPACP